MCFNKTYNNTPYFIVGKIKNRAIGFMPLEFHKSINKYIFFGGGDWNEKFRFYIKENHKKEALPIFLEQIAGNKGLWNIHESELRYFPNLQKNEPAYFLNPKDYNFDINRYISHFSSKQKKHLRSEFKKIESLGTTIIFNNFKQISALIKLNKKKFGKESLLNEKEFASAFKLLLKNKALKNILRLISVNINNDAKAIALCAIHNNTYTFLQEGVSPDIPNLSKYLHYQVITDAFRLKTEKIDFMADDCNWKEKWLLKKEMMYKI